MRKVIILFILGVVTGFEVGQPTWTQVNTDGFGDVNNKGSHCMAVYGGNLYVGTWNQMTGIEVWQTHLSMSMPHITKPIDVNRSMISLASYRISQVQNLLKEIQRTCDKLKDEDDPLYSTCCANRLDEITEY